MKIYETPKKQVKDNEQKDKDRELKNQTEIERTPVWNLISPETGNESQTQTPTQNIEKDNT